MIFIYEPQLDYNKPLSEDFLPVYAINEAGYIYNFLFDLVQKDPDTFSEISKIIFLKDRIINNGPIRKSFNKYKSLLLNYSPYGKNYVGEKYYPEILDSLPHPNKITTEASRIAHLINCSELLSSQECLHKIQGNLRNDSEPYIIYLPFNKAFLGSIIELSLQPDKIIFYSHSEMMRTKEFIGIEKVDSSEYFKIIKKLEKARQEELSILNSNISELRNYRPPELLKNFSEAFYNLLLSANSKKHISITGIDEFLMLRITNQILRNTIPIYYDLRTGVPEIDSESNANVLLNGDSLVDFTEVKKLFYKLKNISSEDYIIIHKIREAFYKLYFNTYMVIDLPSQDFIKSILTNIFIALINETTAFDDLNYRLDRISRSQCLNDLLSSFGSIEQMYQTISNLKSITTKDLLFNADLWYHIRKKSNLHASNKTTKKKKIIKLVHDGSGWEITGLQNNRKLKFPDLKGLMLLAIILEYKQHISYGDITKILFEFDQKELSKAQEGTHIKPRQESFLEFDRYRKNYFANFNYLRKGVRKKDNHPSKNDRYLLSEFIRETIQCIDNGYTVKEDDCNYLVIDSKLQKIIQQFKRDQNK